MRIALSALFGLLVAAVVPQELRADCTWEFSVQASATVQTNPAQITLSWPQDTSRTPINYTVFRKAPEASSWGEGVTLPGSATNYVDPQVSAGTPYEYQIVKKTSQYTGYGYVYAGINLPATEDRGKLLLIVDNTHAVALQSELARLEQDLIGDGWMLKRMDVSRTDSVVSVKSLITREYRADPEHVSAVFLFGHIPVPYSGDIVPDGHMPDHQGAWPCDGFYGDMEGTWTDSSVNDGTAAEARTRNFPGDGKYDQSTFPAPLKLMVGRVDLANLPGRLSWGGAATFPSELELLRNYLNKDHKFRNKQFDLPRRSMVGDYFGYRNGEAFAASGWRNFAAFFSATNVTPLPDQGTWITTLRTNPCLFAYGCGAGSYTSIGGLGQSDVYNDGITTELMANDPKTVFALLFGSWLGDWDSEDNILRSVLALPSYGLAAVWSGRPHWFMHHMAMGAPIGYSARLTQNNRPNGMYRNQLNSCAGQTHIALMGDPTLRMHMVSPPTSVRAEPRGEAIDLSWRDSPDSIVGYHVYRAPTVAGPFRRLTAVPIRSVVFSESSPGGTPVYMVRAVKLEVSASGTYFNLSQGAFSTPAQSSPSEPIVQSPSTGGSPALAAGAAGFNGDTNVMIWMDDTLPPGAVGGAEGGDGWNWITDSPSPFSGRAANQSGVGTGLQQHYFSWAAPGLVVEQGDTLFAYVFIDAASPPSELMLQWNDGTWEHRAYWGADRILYGEDGTASRTRVGALPPAGRWVRLQVSAAELGLEGRTITGMAFAQFGGRATWDAVGKTRGNPPAPGVARTPSSGSLTPPSS